MQTNPVVEHLSCLCYILVSRSLLLTDMSMMVTGGLSASHASYTSNSTNKLNNRWTDAINSYSSVVASVMFEM